MANVGVIKKLVNKFCEGIEYVKDSNTFYGTVGGYAADGIG